MDGGSRKWNLSFLRSARCQIYTCYVRTVTFRAVWFCGWTCFSPNFNFFFLLKLSAVCTFWIVLMCWCQKWFLKNEKTSLTCISARKAIWKATTTTLPNTLLYCKIVFMTSFATHSFKILKNKLYVLDYFDMLILKIIF